jgi:hypothetical protein
MLCMKRPPAASILAALFRAQAHGVADSWACASLQPRLLLAHALGARHSPKTFLIFAPFLSDPFLPRAVRTNWRNPGDKVSPGPQ